MIDFEKEIFDIIAQEVRDNHPGTMVYSSYPKSNIGFPMATIELGYNPIYQKSLDSSNEEKHSVHMFNVNVLSNLDNQNKAKMQTKSILNTIDEKFLALGFRRVSTQNLPNTEDTTIYRMVARYDGVISKDGQVYRG